MMKKVFAFWYHQSHKKFANLYLQTTLLTFQVQGIVVDTNSQPLVHVSCSRMELNADTASWAFAIQKTCFGVL